MKALLQSLDRQVTQLRQQQCLGDLAISDSGFVFSPHSGRSFIANESALTILRGLRDELDMEALLKHLTDEFDVGEDEALLAMEPFMLELETILS